MFLLSPPSFLLLSSLFHRRPLCRTYISDGVMLLYFGIPGGFSSYAGQRLEGLGVFFGAKIAGRRINRVAPAPPVPTGERLVDVRF